MGKNGGQIISTTNDAVIRTMFKTLLPAQILATATNSLGSIVNTFLVGNHLNAEALTALGLIVPLNALLGAVSTIISGGARIMCGDSLGRGDEEGQRKIFSSSMIVLIAVGIVLSVLGLLFGKELAVLFGATGEFVSITALYIKGLVPGFLPALLIPCLMIFLQMKNDSSFSLVVSVLLAVFSLAFGLLNLYGMNGGVLGMGIADSGAKWIVLIIIFIRFKTRKIEKLTWKTLSSKQLLRLVWIGLPTSLATILYALRNSSLNHIALRFIGNEAVSALAILNSSMGPVDAVNIGVGTTCLMMSSLYLGMKDRLGVKTVLSLTLKVGLLLTLVKFVLIVSIAKPLACLFGAQGGLGDITAGLIRAYAFTFVPNIILISFVSVHQCLNRIKLISVFYVFSALLIPVGFARFFAPLLKMNAINWCYAISEVLSIIFFYVIGFCMGGRSLRIDEMVGIPDDVGQNINFSVSNVDEVVQASSKAIDFCKENGIDKRRSYYCGLCLEEIAANSVEHGFAHSKEKKGWNHQRKLSVDIFLHIDEGNILLRICDNCTQFNPLKFVDVTDDASKDKYLGIQLVRHAAEEFNYQSTFGQNMISILWKEKAQDQNE